MKTAKPRGIVRYSPSGAFAQHAMAACFSVSAAMNTRKAYWSDVRNWLAFCEQREVDPAKPASIAVIAWNEQMRRDGSAPKTRSRRMAALSSVYDRLRRDRQVTDNPFSVDNGPERERALVANPTPIASPESVRRVMATCDPATFEGIRDAAMIRILWATGARRASITSMTLERLRPDGPDYISTLIGKGNKEIRVLIRGAAAKALRAWLAELERGQIRRGGIWRSQSGAQLGEKDIWRMLRRRAQEANVTEQFSPHTFRVAFLTLNPAGLEAKQDAAGHADPATTRLYDRTSWRGREAFESMPEIEDAT